MARTHQHSSLFILYLPYSGATPLSGSSPSNTRITQARPPLVPSCPNDGRGVVSIMRRPPDEHPQQNAYAYHRLDGEIKPCGKKG